MKKIQIVNKFLTLCLLGLVASVASAQTNTFTLLSAVAGVGQYVKCEAFVVQRKLQGQQTNSTILLAGLGKEALSAWSEVLATEKAYFHLKQYIEREQSRFDGIQRSGVEIEHGSPLDKQMDALAWKKKDLQKLGAAMGNARRKFRELATVKAVFTKQIYGGMQVWRVVKD